MSDEMKTGKLEMTPAALQEKYGDAYKDSIKQLKLNDIVPGVLNDPKKGRHFITHLRVFLDEALKADGCAYFFLKEGGLGIYTGEMDPAVAGLKIKAMASMIAKIGQRMGEDGRMIGVERKKAEAVEKLSFDVPAGQDRLHLPQGEITEDNYSNWLSKANSDLEKNIDIRRLAGDIKVMSDLMIVKYQPVYFVQNKLISGYSCQNYKPLLLRIPERQPLQDIAVLGTAVRSLYKMSEAGQQFSLIFVNIDATTLKNKTARSFLNTYCRNLPKSLKKYLIFCITGLKENKLDSEEWDDLRALLPHCRSMMMDTGIKAVSPVQYAQVNFGSFGFNVGAVRMPEESLVGSVAEYCQYYRKEKKTSFIFNISNKELRDKAMAAGVTYISGPGVLHAVDQPGPARVIPDLDAELAQGK